MLIRKTKRMELDKRIKALTDIQSVTNGCHDWEFMTKKGYFADSLANFQDLSKCEYGEYAGYREHDKCFYCEVILPDGTPDYNWFTYFIPEDILLPEEKPVEKKYRAFTLSEWINQYEIGQIIHYRCKSPEIELRHMYTGYAYGIGADIEKTTSGTLTLGVASYALDYLFEEYELEMNGVWQPFGIEVKENEE